MIDADALAREVVEPGTEGLAAVVAEFGQQVLDGAGRLDRPALARVVFGDEAARDRLNAILHPRIRARAAELIAAAPPGTVVVQDVPLLVETGQAGAYDLVVVVQAPEEQRVQRLARDRGMPAAEARARMASQASDEQRRAAADVVLVNDGTPDELRAKVDAVWAERVAGPTPERSGTSLVAGGRPWPLSVGPVGPVGLGSVGPVGTQAGRVRTARMRWPSPSRAAISSSGWAAASAAASVASSARTAGWSA